MINLFVRMDTSAAGTLLRSARFYLYAISSHERIRRLLGRL